MVQFRLSFYLLRYCKIQVVRFNLYLDTGSLLHRKLVSARN